MTYFLTDETLEVGKEYTLKGEEASHILKSRRLKKGEGFHIQDAMNTRFKVSPRELHRHHLTFIPVEKVECPKEPEFKIHLFQALVKEKAADFIIQKATELGVSRLYFFESQNSQILKSQKEIDKKLERWKKIALEACKQSDRLTPPDIFFEKDISCVSSIAKQSLEAFPTFILDIEGKGAAASDALKSLKGVNILVGPEGGFIEEEFSELKTEKLYLGPRVLRADTAAISSLVLMQYLLGDLSK